MMMTIDAIMEEIKSVPADKLEEVYKYVHSLANKSEALEKRKKSILALAGCLSDMSEAELKDFDNHLKETRSQLFNRNFDI